MKNANGHATCLLGIRVAVFIKTKYPVQDYEYNYTMIPFWHYFIEGIGTLIFI